MNKKILAIALGSGSTLLALGLTLVLYYNIPRLTYTYSDVYEGYLVKKAYGNKKSYTIPSAHKGKPVKGISTRAFFRKGRLEEIIFEDESSIEVIGRLAFSECKRLESIDMENVLVIEKNAFAMDSSLKEVSTGAQYIGASAFYGCKELSDVTLLSGVSSIGSLAFAECESLHALYLPSTVKDVYADAFAYTPLSLLEAPHALVYNTYVSGLDYVQFYEENSQ